MVQVLLPPALTGSGEQVTVPLPAETDVEMMKAVRVNAATTDVSVLMVTRQLPVPEHAPDQPAKEEIASGEAVRVTTAPSL